MPVACYAIFSHPCAAFALLHVRVGAEVDITHIDMGDEAGNDTPDLRFVVAVRDRNHLETALRNLRRTPSVLKAQRARIATQLSAEPARDSER